MNKEALSALIAVGLDRRYADLIRGDSPIRIWPLTSGAGASVSDAAREARQRHVVRAYQLEVPLITGPTWWSEITEPQARMVKAALDRAGVGYLSAP